MTTDDQRAGAAFLPCPFCGGPPTPIVSEPSGMWHGLMCKHCPCKVHGFREWRDALNAWNNRRASDKREGEDEVLQGLQRHLERCVAAFDTMRTDGFADGPLPGEYDTAEDHARWALEVFRVLSQPKPAGSEDKPESHWWCPSCREIVLPQDVTFEEVHSKCGTSVLDKPAGEAGGWEWSKTPPRYPGLYWHWTGDPDASPLPYTVFCREVGSCFITRGQYGIDHARECSNEAGWWLRLDIPRTPPADPNVEWRIE